jgi:hypothetical protein
MRSADLTAAQLATIEAKLAPMLRYLNQLTSRMESQHFPADDKLYRLAADARNAVHDLRVRVHYLSCKRTTCGRQK